MSDATSLASHCTQPERLQVVLSASETPKNTPSTYPPTAVPAPYIYEGDGKEQSLEQRVETNLENITDRTDCIGFLW